MISTFSCLLQIRITWLGAGLSGLCFWLASCSPSFGDLNTQGSESFYLQLKNGTSGFGRIVSFTDDEHLVWQNEGFKTPFEFPIRMVRSITTTTNFNQDYPQGQFVDWFIQEGKRPRKLHITDQTQLVGVPVELTADHLRMKTLNLGTVTVDRSRAVRISDINSYDFGLSPITEKKSWRPIDRPADWLITEGGCSTTVRGATIATPVNLFEHLELHLRIRWEGSANFLLGLGANQLARIRIAGRAIQIDGDRVARPGNSLTCPLAIEAWAGKLFAVQENGKSMETASLGDYGNQSGTLELIVTPGNLTNATIIQVVGGPRIELKRSGNVRGQRLEELVLRNQGKFLALDRIGVRINSSFIGNDAALKSPILIINQEVQSAGGIRSWDFRRGLIGVEKAGEKELILVPEEHLESARIFAASENPEKSAAAQKERSASSLEFRELELSDRQAIGNFRIFLSDGTKIVATVNSIESGRLATTIPGVAEVVYIPVTSIVEFYPVSTSAADSVQERAPDGFQNETLTGNVSRGSVADDATDIRRDSGEFLGTAYVGFSQLIGRLADSPENSESTSLRWMPDFSRTASEVDSKFRVDFRSSSVEVQEPSITRKSGPMIELTTGDEIPAVVTHIDENNLHFRSSTTQQTSLSQRWVKRVCFRDTAARPLMTAEQRQRLLSVPLAQQHDPPTHLLIASSGDILKGRLTSLSEGLVTAEIRGRLVQLPLSQVHEVIWLYDRAWEPQSADQNHQIQIVMDDSKTTMLETVRVKGGMLVGFSQMFGDISVPLASLSRVSTGTTASKSDYRLTLAPESKSANEP